MTRHTEQPRHTTGQQQVGHTQHTTTQAQGKPVIREATLDDYDEAVALYKPLWCGGLHEQGMADDEELCARYNVALHFARSPIALVVELGGHVVGLSLATVFDQGKPRTNPAWEPVFAEMSARVAERLSGADELMREQFFFDGREYEEAACLVASGNPYAEAEANLLIVGEELRGHGMGKTLLDAARMQMRAEGRSRFFLMTDTACDWRFYEHLGMERLDLASVVGPGHDPDIFAYGGSC